MSGPADSTAAPSVGERLRAARDRQGLTLQKLAEDLHLDLRLLEAMEENRFRALGAPVYARGHLRKYAQLLGLDVDVLLTDYEAAHAGPVAPSLVPSSVKHPARVPGRSRVGPVAGIVAIAVVVLAGIGGGVWWWHSRAFHDERRQVPATVEAETPESSSAASRAGIVSPTASPTVSPMASPVVPSTPPGAVASAANQALRPAPLGQAESVDGSVARLRMRFLGECWVEVYDAAGKRLYYDQDAADTARTVVGTPPLRVLLGNYSAVELTLDGRSVAIPERARFGATARFRVLPGGTTLASWGP
jgi:cytoskeleton protein RodZ